MRADIQAPAGLFCMRRSIPPPPASKVFDFNDLAAFPEKRDEVTAPNACHAFAILLSTGPVDKNVGKPRQKDLTLCVAQVNKFMLSTGNFQRTYLNQLLSKFQFLFPAY